MQRLFCRKDCEYLQSLDEGEYVCVYTDARRRKPATSADLCKCWDNEALEIRVYREPDAPCLYDGAIFDVIFTFSWKEANS